MKQVCVLGNGQLGRMLRQAGAAAAQTLDSTPDEARTWLAATDKLALTHIHACWQLTLEGQRRVLNALEPAQALELLLLNLTVLPALIPVQNLPGASLPDIPARAADKQPAPASESTPEAAPAPTTGSCSVTRDCTGQFSQVTSPTASCASLIGSWNSVTSCSFWLNSRIVASSVTSG